MTREGFATDAEQHRYKEIWRTMAREGNWGPASKDPSRNDPPSPRAGRSQDGSVASPEATRPTP